MGRVEEENLKKRKLQDINLEIVNEHFQNLKLITQKVFTNYVQIKSA